MCTPKLPCPVCGAGTSCHHTHPSEGRLTPCTCPPAAPKLGRPPKPNKA